MQFNLSKNIDEIKRLALENVDALYEDAMIARGYSRPAIAAARAKKLELAYEVLSGDYGAFNDDLLSKKFPPLADEIGATGNTVTEVAQAIVAAHKASVAEASSLERMRIHAKAKIRNAPDIRTIEDEKQPDFWNV